METNERYPSKAQFRVVLTDEELQFPAIDDLCNKYHDWLKSSEVSAGGRKTRAANRRGDTIYSEIMAFKLPPLKIEATPVSPQRPVKTVQYQNNGHTNNNLKNSIDSDNESSSSVASSGATASGRTLRPRCRTPSVSRKQEIVSPSTPTHQSIRAHMKKNLGSNSSNVFSAALNQEHPSVSLTKMRQLLRADSAQKKRDEERERQERARLERKVKEEKAEAQKKKLLEERAKTAKLNREQRLLHAAEVRKAREEAKIERKLKEPLPAIEPIAKQTTNAKQTKQAAHAPALPAQNQQKEQNAPHSDANQPIQQQTHQPQQQQPLPKQPPKLQKLDETFQKPVNEGDNIDISIQDETNDEQTRKANPVADWAKGPYLRDAVIHQFSKIESQLMNLALEIFGAVKLPVDLDKIFASHTSNDKRYLVRTSSAVWTTPYKPLKRASSDVFTPTDQEKRSTKPKP